MGLFILITTMVAALVTGYETDPQIKGFVDNKVEVVQEKTTEAVDYIAERSTPVDYSKMND